jgi:hypothetical protein
MDWRKSSYSQANGGACLETASSQGAVMVRDTTEGGGPYRVTLSISAPAWERFTASLR